MILISFYNKSLISIIIKIKNKLFYSVFNWKSLDYICFMNSYFTILSINNL